MSKKLTRLFSIFTVLVLTFSPMMTLKAQNRQLTRENETKLTQKRIALVIGNGTYTKAKPLPNPPNDAADMAKSLKDLGFEVLSGVNQNKRQMEALIREFGAKLSSGGTGLFYYAGHGIQVGGENYLVPVDADIPDEDEVSYSAVPVSLVLTKMTTAKNDLNIVILDACRNNPFARSWRTFRDGGNNDGLAKITPPTGTLVLYATEPGKVASDGAGRNGLFTEALLKQMKKPNVEYDQMVKAVSTDVWQKSNKQQLPWKEGNSLSDFYFVTTETTPTKTESEPTIVAKDKAAQEREAWDLVKNSADAEDFRFYLKEFPTGANADRAKIRLEELVWFSVKNTTEKMKVQAYLNEFPTGANASSARIKLRQLETPTPTKTPNPNGSPENLNADDALAELEAWNKIKNSSNTVDFQTFLQKYPTGAFAGQARAKISNIGDAEWNRVKTSKDPNVYKAYIAANPSGQYTTEARARLNMLVASMVAFEQIRDSKDVEDFKNYVAKYPDGVFVEDARANFEPPKIGTMRRNSIGMEFMYIPAGDFQMGSTNGSGDEKPVHKVTISQGFFMGRTEVTQEQYEKVMGNNPSNFKGCPKCPVEQVSWDDAQSFVAKLNAQNDGFKYRLPTEAEWEYAARSGTTGDYAGNLDAMAWYGANSGNKTHEVGTKQANAWGLFDMHGNVWEWCQDWYGDSYYANSPSVNPTGATSGSYRVYRGGGWSGDAVDLRSAARDYGSPSLRGSLLGFRVVRITL